MTFVGLGRLRRRGSGADPLGVSTKSRARVAVEPATFWAVHWYQAASDALARGMSSVEAPLSIVMCTSGPGTIGTPSWKQMLQFPSINHSLSRHLSTYIIWCVRTATCCGHVWQSPGRSSTIIRDIRTAFTLVWMHISFVYCGNISKISTESVLL